MGESDSEYEEEDTLVMVELHGVIDSEIFAQDSFEKFKILAVDSERPILQVENFVFSGEYEHTLGTAIFFEEEDKRVKKCDPVFCKKPSRMLKYVCKTNKKLTMKRVFVSEKQQESTETDASDSNMNVEQHSEYVYVGNDTGSSSNSKEDALMPASEEDDSLINQDVPNDDPLSLNDLCGAVESGLIDPLNVTSATDGATTSQINDG